MVFEGFGLKNGGENLEKLPHDEVGGDTILLDHEEPWIRIVADC
jgi:hypothetical protein